MSKKGIQGFAWLHKSLQGYTRVCMGIVYKGLQSGVYKGLHWYARVYRHMKFYRGKQGTIGVFRGLQGYISRGLYGKKRFYRGFY